MWHESARRRLLAVRLDNIGDVVMLGPALRAMRPAAESITLLASPAGARAAVLLPWVDHVIEARVSWQDVSGRLAEDRSGDEALIAELREGRFDASVIFTSFRQSPHPAAYACYLAGIPDRTAQSKEFAGAVLTRAVAPPPDDAHQVERNLHLLRSIGVDVADDELDVSVPEPACVRARSLLQGRGLRPGGYALVAPGAGAPARRYPSSEFAETTRLLAEEGRDVLVLGSDRERELVERVSSVHERAIGVAGETDVAEWAALVADATVVVTNDSGTMHLADALRTPAAVAFSGTDLPSQWRPRHSPSALLTVSVPCAPCYSIECVRHKECLGIPPERLAAEATRLADENAASAA